MRPSLFMGADGLPRATYVGSAFQHITGTTPYRITVDLAGAGAQINDFCMVHIQTLGDPDFPSVIAGEGWLRDNYTWSAYGYRTSVLHKRLASLAELRIQASSTNGVMNVTTLAYRGPNAAQRRVIVQDNDGSSAHVTPGFVRSGNSVGVVGFLADRDPTAPAGTVTSPGGVITKRRDDQWSYFRTIAVDALPKAAYVDGAAITWTGLATPNYEVSQLYELLIT